MQNLAYKQYEVLLKLLNNESEELHNQIQNKIFSIFSKISKQQSQIDILEQELNDDLLQNEKNNAIQA